MSLATAFREQAKSNEALGSPFSARVLRLVADRIAPGSPVTDRMLAFEGDIGPSGQSVPLRLLGGLHALVLAGEDPDLAACYPPNPATDDATLGAALDAALATRTDTLLTYLALPPQTNEVRRSAVMIAAGHWLADRYGLPFVLTELGASAGLNLMWDRYALDLPCGYRGPADPAVTLSPDWTGPCPPEAKIEVTDRRGIDVAPLDVHDPADELRLLSYLWADQPERIERTRAAIAVYDAQVDQSDAMSFLPIRVAIRRPGHIHLVFHTIAWQYFPPATKAACEIAFEAAGKAATLDAPIARLSMEADGQGPGAAMTLTTWPGGEVHNLGRVDFHGRWVDWRAP
ncbi:DUF2332 family protein [uncultured Maritimibacter sp.]|uniref:DUF2332 domain-containing protein n=1 Tax=uncultured Maritimibacter sp. TaxID=991866 RepID=UPI002592CB34|nr:DUF2332 family protein [uncultured Maritimibacter sp.]